MDCTVAQHAARALRRLPSNETLKDSYVYVSTPKTWQDAEADCVSRGSHLATCCTVEEVKAARAAAKQGGGAQDDFWIGLHDRATENDWVWTSGSTCKFKNWVYEHHEPNGGTRENCVHTWGGPARGPQHADKWNDRSCDIKNPFVCGSHDSNTVAKQPCLPGWTEVSAAAAGPVAQPSSSSLATAAGCFRHFPMIKKQGEKTQTRISFVEAEAWCVAHGANLATIDTAYQNELVRQLVSIEQRPLIGMNDISTEGTWEWVDGRTSSYRNWMEGRPDNLRQGEDCTVMLQGGGQWNDVPCTPFEYKDRIKLHAQGFICRMTHYNHSTYAPAASELVTFCDRPDGMRTDPTASVGIQGAGHCCTLTQGRYGTTNAPYLGNTILSQAPCPVLETHGISYMRANGECSVNLYYGKDQVVCAAEGGRCICPAGGGGAWAIIYGKGSVWSKARMVSAAEGSDSVACTNGVFGNPLVGIRKECRCISGYGRAKLEGPGTWSGPGGDFTDNAITGVEVVCGEGHLGGYVFHKTKKTWNKF